MLEMNCWVWSSTGPVGLKFTVRSANLLITLMISSFLLTLKVTTAQVVETSVTVNNNSPFQDYVHPDDQTQPTFEMTPGFKPFTVSFECMPFCVCKLKNETEIK